MERAREEKNPLSDAEIEQAFKALDLDTEEKRKKVLSQGQTYGSENQDDPAFYLYRLTNTTDQESR